MILDWYFWCQSYKISTKSIGLSVNTYLSLIITTFPTLYLQSHCRFNCSPAPPFVSHRWQTCIQANKRSRRCRKTWRRWPSWQCLPVTPMTPLCLSGSGSTYPPSDLYHPICLWWMSMPTEPTPTPTVCVQESQLSRWLRFPAVLIPDLFVQKVCQLTNRPNFLFLVRRHSTTAEDCS